MPSSHAAAAASAAGLRFATRLSALRTRLIGASPSRRRCLAPFLPSRGHPALARSLRRLLSRASGALLLTAHAPLLMSGRCHGRRSLRGVRYGGGALLLLLACLLRALQPEQKLVVRLGLKSRCLCCRRRGCCESRVRRGVLTATATATHIIVDAVPESGTSTSAASASLLLLHD